MPPQDLLNRFFDGLGRRVPMTLISLVPFVALGLTIIYLRQRFFDVDHRGLLYFVVIQPVLLVTMDSVIRRM